MRLLLAPFALALVAAAAPASGPPPRCRVSVSLTPAPAYVGQQLLYDLRILRRRDVAELRWEDALRFPALRAEWLPGRSDDVPVEQGGETYDVFHERRALFPAHAGELRVPGASLRCMSADGEEIVAVPPVTLTVAPLPAAGRPEGFEGVVGRVRLSASVSPKRPRLGESVRVSVLAQGAANLWDAAPPADALGAAADFELFARPEQLARDAGRSLVVRRYFVYDLVPRRAGELRIPALEIPFYDPEAGRYGTARVDAQPLLVAPPETAAGGTPPTERPAAVEPRGRGRSALLLATATATAVAAAAAWALVRGRRARGDGFADVHALVREAEAASDPERRAGLTDRALRRALRRFADRAQALSAEELAALGLGGAAAREAAALVGRLEAARFSGDREAVRAALADVDLGGLARALQDEARLLDSAQ